MIITVIKTIREFKLERKTKIEEEKTGNMNFSIYRLGTKNTKTLNLKLIFLWWLRFGRTQNKSEEQKYIRGAVENKHRG